MSPQHIPNSSLSLLSLPFALTLLLTLTLTLSLPFIRDPNPDSKQNPHS